MNFDETQMTRFDQKLHGTLLVFLDSEYNDEAIYKYVVFSFSENTFMMRKNALMWCL